MSAELPPWPARCEADNLAMFKWLIRSWINSELLKSGEREEFLRG